MKGFAQEYDGFNRKRRQLTPNGLGDLTPGTGLLAARHRWAERLYRVRTLLWCGLMNVVWLGGMAYLALDNAANFDPRALVGTAVAWLLATAASWLLFRGTPGAQWWQLAVWTFLVSIVALVFVTISAAFVAPPPPV